jgi:hypothetical protein
MAPASAEQLTAAVQASANNAKYSQTIDRESAYELLAAKVQAGAEQAEAEKQQQEEAKQQEAPRPRAQKQEKSMVEQVIGSSAFKQFARSAGREIVRGLFGAARKRR